MPAVFVSVPPVCVTSPRPLKSPTIRLPEPPLVNDPPEITSRPVPPPLPNFVQLLTLNEPPSEMAMVPTTAAVPDVRWPTISSFEAIANVPPTRLSVPANCAVPDPFVCPMITFPPDAWS